MSESQAVERQGIRTLSRYIVLGVLALIILALVILTSPSLITLFD